MKILFFIDSLGAGGAERSILELVKFLNEKNGIEVSVACLKRQRFSFEEDAEKLGIPLFFGEENEEIRKKIIFLKNIVEKQEPDVIHSTLTESNLIVRLFRIFKNIKKIKVVQSLVNTPYSSQRKKDSNLPWQKFQMIKQLDKWTARVNPQIFYHAITQKVIEHYKPLYWIKDNYQVIYRGRRENPYLSKDFSKRNFTLINVGRQEFAKGQIDILRAMRYLRDFRGVRDIQLQILGRPGEYSEKINHYIEQNDLKDQVEIIGFVNDVEQRLVKADAFVFPSYYEGLGGALLEASAARLPCICSNIPVLKEVVGKEEGALFCAPGDYKKLGDNIYQLYRNTELRRKLAEYSIENFQRRFRIEKVHGEMLNMYESLLYKK